MSAFECNVTPTRIRNARKRNEDREPTIVDLRPFTAKSIVTFEDVPVTKTARRIITIINPFPEVLKVTIIKRPKPEHNIAFEWLEHQITAEGKIDLEVVWNPLKAVSCREVIEISDNFGNKKSIAVILKSCEIQKTMKRKTGPVDYNKKLKLKAPSPPKIYLNRHLSTVSHSHTVRHEFMENYIVEEQQKDYLTVPMSPKRKTNSILNSVKSPLRNATNIQHYEEETYNSPSLNTGKENGKHATPTNASSLFDSIKFTPLTETKPKCESKLEYLSSLPTPIAVKRDDIFVPKDVDTRNQAISPDMLRNIATSQKVIDDTPKRHLPVKQNSLPTKLVLDDEIDEHLTYIKGPSVEEIDEIEIILTPTLSTPDNEDFQTPECNEFFPEGLKLQATFKINKSLSFNDNFGSETFECQHPDRILSESMNEQVEMPTQSEIEKLKANQGSMPNLNDINVRHIEHNRYFNQERNQNLSMESVISNTDFKELETCAQSSRLNLNEIGKPPKSSSPVLQKQQKKAESPLKFDQKKKFISPAKYQREKMQSSPTIQRIKEEQELESTNTQIKKKVMTFSPPRTKLSDINPRETFFISSNSNGRDIRATTWKQQQNQQMFAVPKLPASREFSHKSIGSTISQSLTSLSSSVTSLSSTCSMPVSSGKLYNENFINAYKQKDPFCATTTEDPFLTSSMYLDELTLDRIEKSFKKWLNALVTIPPDLETDRNEKVDVAKLFNDVQNKELTLAPTKELVCSQYYTARLDQLRSMAVRFFHSEEISKPLNKLAVIINEKKLLEVHSARNIHLDMVLQRSLLELILCFNPLWLRIGLEVVFNVQLNLHSNQDILGMSRFIITHMFKSPYLQQKYSKYSQQQELLDKLKKHTAKHFLFLIFFLDHAKEHRLIKQNPCLFIKSAPYKETAEILKKFASLVLANYGDIVRMLKRLDFTLSHKQTVIDEYDFAFKNLAIDLRDGVRLTKVMEVILLRDDLVKRVRVPAISRLQKVHNVELALKALESAEYKILGNITAKDIADGHREKTLSLLWQIIYKFRAPRFNAAAKTIQKFWRSKWLKIVIERRIRMKEEEKLNNAAIVIQKYFRGWRARQSAKEYRVRIINSCIIIQKHCRGYLARKQYKLTQKSIKFVQKRYRLIKYTKSVRRVFIETKVSTVKIQIWWRRQILIKKIQASAIVIEQIQKEVRDKGYQAALKIQKYWKGYEQMKKERINFLKLKEMTLKMQNLYRGKLQMRKDMQMLTNQRNSVIRIQQIWRATLEMRKQQTKYKKDVEKVIFIQRKVRAIQAMRKERENYTNTRNSIIAIQKYWKGYRQMKEQRTNFLELRIAAIIFQNTYRAQVAMRIQRQKYLKQKKSAIVIQRFWRSRQVTKQERTNFVELKENVIKVQNRFRANLMMRECRKEFLYIRQEIIKIQKYWRCTIETRKQRIEYQKVVSTIVFVQKFYRSKLLTKSIQKEFLETRNSAITIQKYFRGYIKMKEDQKNFLDIKTAASALQKHYRARLEMKIQRTMFLKQKESAIKIQKYWRSYLEMRKQRFEFMTLRECVTKIQLKFRGYLMMRKIQQDYLHKRTAIINIQQYWRATLDMRKQRQLFRNDINSIIFVQHRFRANRAMKKDRIQFLIEKKSAIKIQTFYRTYINMKEQKSKFLVLKSAAISIQKHYRARLAMKAQRRKFLKQKESAIKIQRFWRGRLLMKQHKSHYIREISLIKMMQVRYRSKLGMREIRKEFLQKRTAIINVQRHWRGLLEMRKQRDEYKNAVSRIVWMQRKFRANQAMQEAVLEFKKQKCAIIKIQKWFRSCQEMIKVRNEFLTLKKTVLVIENRIIANKLKKIEQQKFSKLKNATIYVQRRFRSKIETRKIHQQFIKSREMIVKIQTHARGYLARKRFQEMKTPERIEERRRQKSARTIQAAYRGYKERSKKSNKCFVAIVQRLMKVSKNVDPTQTLAAKLKVSIDFLKYRYDSSLAITALAKLEYMARTVPWILNDDAEFISAFCMGIMGQAIRSEVDKQIIELCSCIILNLGRYHATKEDAFQESGLITIAQMLLRWCDKDCGIFNTLCTLIWVFAHCKKKKRIIRNFMMMKDGEYIMSQIKQNVLRKENMRKNSRRPIGFQSISLIKYKKDYQLQLRHQPTVYSSGFITAEMLKQCRQLPSLEPDYGVVRMHPYIFYSSVFAFDCVLAALDITNVK
ncbi:hypothetical protein ACKWTF_011267 [Chironomus riparius]